MQSQEPIAQRGAKLQRAGQLFLELAFVGAILAGLLFPVLFVHADHGASLYDGASAQTTQVSQQDALPSSIGMPSSVLPGERLALVPDRFTTLSRPSPSGGRAPPTR
jgi:hypothetical protein